MFEYLFFKFDIYSLNYQLKKKLSNFKPKKQQKRVLFIKSARYYAKG